MGEGPPLRGVDPSELLDVLRAGDIDLIRRSVEWTLQMEASVHGVSTPEVDDLVKASVRMRGSPNRRCHASAPHSTKSSRRSALERWEAAAILRIGRGTTHALPASGVIRADARVCPASYSDEQSESPELPCKALADEPGFGATSHALRALRHRPSPMMSSSSPTTSWVLLRDAPAAPPPNAVTAQIRRQSQLDRWFVAVVGVL